MTKYLAVVEIDPDKWVFSGDADYWREWLEDHIRDLDYVEAVAVVIDSD